MTELKAAQGICIEQKFYLKQLACLESTMNSYFSFGLRVLENPVDALEQFVRSQIFWAQEGKAR